MMLGARELDAYMKHKCPSELTGKIKPRREGHDDKEQETKRGKERPDIVAKGCTHFPQVLVWERKRKLKLGLKVGEDSKRTPHKYGHACVGFFLTASPTRPCYA